MTRWTKLAAIAIGFVMLWLGLLLALDGVLAGRQATGISSRVAESLHGSGSVDGADLALVRGRLSLEGLRVRRDDPVGHLAIDVAAIDCELPPLGWALVDSRCRELDVRGTRLEVSTTALFQLEHPRRPPIRVDRVVIDDAELLFAPSAFLPGLGRVAIVIEHAVAGETVLRTPLSWLFALLELRARIELPAGISVQLRFGTGRLAAAGPLFGGGPVELPVELPSANAAHDARGEIQLLISTGKQLAARLVEKRATDWIETKFR
jgi:hypothetical protein